MTLLPFCQDSMHQKAIVFVGEIYFLSPALNAWIFGACFAWTLSLTTRPSAPKKPLISQQTPTDPHKNLKNATAARAKYLHKISSPSPNTTNSRS